MRTIRLSLSLCLACVLSLARPAHAHSRFDLRISGGPGYLLTGEDFQSLFDTTAQRWTSLGYTGDYDLHFTRWIADANLDLVLQFNEYIGIGAGVGYLTKSWTQYPRLEYNWVTPGRVDSRNHYEVHSIPLSLQAIFILPGRRLDLRTTVGLAYYATKLKVSLASDYSEPLRSGQAGWTQHLSQDFDSAWMGHLGYHFGIGAEYRLSPRIYLALDLFYRLVTVTNFKGAYDFVDRQSWNGGSSEETLHQDKAIAWRGRINCPGQVWQYIDFWEVQPDLYDCVQPFKVDLTGFSLRIGFKVRLGRTNREATLHR